MANLISKNFTFNWQFEQQISSFIASQQQQQQRIVETASIIAKWLCDCRFLMKLPFHTFLYFLCCCCCFPFILYTHCSLECYRWLRLIVVLLCFAFQLGVWSVCNHKQFNAIYYYYLIGKLIEKRRKKMSKQQQQAWHELKAGQFNLVNGDW